MSSLKPFLSLLLVTAFFSSTLSTPLVYAFSSVERANPSIQLKQSNTAAYLGIRVDLLPRDIAAQLPEDVIVGQGILVSGFAPDSTAPAQGVKKNDILLEYDGHPIFHPEQFIQYIKSDKPGRKLELTLARKGKLIKLPITMGQQAVPLTEDQLDYQYNMQMLGFDGIKIKHLRGKEYEVQIRYLAPDGVVKVRSYNGPYERLLGQIYATPDLSIYAKRQLMATLKDRYEDEKGWFGDFIPFNDGVWSKDTLKDFGLGD